MLATALLLASLVATTPEPVPSGDPTVSFAQTLEHRHARLLEGLELSATWKPSETAPLRLMDSVRFGLMDTPLPLDMGGGQRGGGISGDTRRVLALVLGLIIGFGTGHLVAGSQDGFILFLIVDLAIVVVSSVFRVAFGSSLLWGLGGLALLVSHIIQGLDAYAQAGGQRIVEQTRQRAIPLADVTGGRDAPIITTRSFSFSF
jgi:hypothetical protein